MYIYKYIYIYIYICTHIYIFSLSQDLHVALGSVLDETVEYGTLEGGPNNLDENGEEGTVSVHICIY
jgi:hypothetical protein